MAGFDDILGQDSIKEYFLHAAENNHVSHAYILSGEEGMGKMALAQGFAMVLLCEKQDGKPCMECHGCKMALAKSHPDLIYVSHEKPASIGVNDVREQIQDTISVKPYSSPYKIYIIDEAEKMTVQAQNALLKTIEEPPSYAVIMLLTENQEAFLPTILSRCVQLKLKPVKDSDAKRYLTEHFQVPEEKADIYTAFARGNIGKMIKLATSEKFQDMYDRMVYLLKHIKTMDISELLDYIKKMKEEDVDIFDCLDFMQLWYRDVVMYKVTRDINLMIFKNEHNAINEICEKSGYDGLELILQSIDKAKVRLNANVNQDLTLELMLLTMKEN